MLKAVPAQLFGVSLSSAKRYARVAERGASLTPKKNGGRPPKTDETIRKLLEEDVKECPAATVYERCCYLPSITGESLSSSTLKRLLKRMSFSQKTQCGGAEARLVSKSSMEGDGLGGGGPAAAGFVGEMGANTSLSPLPAWARRGQQAYCSVPRNRGPNTTLLASMNAEGMGPALAVEGAVTAAIFEVYIEEVLAPKLRSGQRMVMDNLCVHKGERIRKLLEARGCCELLYLASFSSPDLNPIEEVFRAS